MRKVIAQFLHLAFLPIRFSGALSFELHPGHNTSMGMMALTRHKRCGYKETIDRASFEMQLTIEYLSGRYSCIVHQSETALLTSWHERTAKSFQLLFELDDGGRIICHHSHIRYKPTTKGVHLRLVLAYRLAKGRHPPVHRATGFPGDGAERASSRRTGESLYKAEPH